MLETQLPAVVDAERSDPEATRVPVARRFTPLSARHAVQEADKKTMLSRARSATLARSLSRTSALASARRSLVTKFSKVCTPAHARTPRKAAAGSLAEPPRRHPERFCGMLLLRTRPA